MARTDMPDAGGTFRATASALRAAGDLPDRDLVLCHLFFGEQHAKTQPQLAQDTRLTLRQVQAAVEQLRRDGVAVCTGNGGVWLTTSPGEVREQYRRLRRRGLHQLANLRRMLRTAEAMDQPATLWDAP